MDMIERTPSLQKIGATPREGSATSGLRTEAIYIGTAQAAQKLQDGRGRSDRANFRRSPNAKARVPVEEASDYGW